MRRSPDAGRLVALAMLPALFALAGCAKGKEHADSTAALDSAGPGRRALVAAAPGAPRPPLPGELAKPLAQYTPDDFYAFAHGLTFGGGVDKPRRCKDAAGCEPKGGKSTSARVDAVDGQDALSARTVPANGVVALRARNTGAYTEDRYGMLPGARYEYYVVVLPGAGNASTWSLQQLDTTPGKRALAQVATGEFHPCDHKRTTNYRANFWTCDEAHASTDSVVKLNLVMQEPAPSPMWVVCSEGCCTLL